jgi:hypothetical protein
MLVRIAEFREPVPVLQSGLARFAPDFDGKPVVLKWSNVTNAMRRFIGGELTSAELTAWAELVTGRSGIEYASEEDDVIEDVLFRLSTPEINEPVTVDLCARLMDQHTSD